MIFTILLGLHIFVCLLLVAIVLLQAGRGSSIASVFGGGASQTLFGTMRATILTKITTVLAALFMLTSISLTILSAKRVSLIKGKGEVIEERR
jgi:preprotein translocase subunit SecG